MTRLEFSKPTCTIDGCDQPQVSRGWCRRHYNRWRRYGYPLGGGTGKGSLQQWILDHASHASDECLSWPFHTDASGAAKCTFMGKRMNAARAMCMVAHGEPPSPHHDAAHSCGKAHVGCVNPRHLRWATKAENQADRVGHGTMLFGSSNPAATLTDQQVAEIIGLRGTDTQKAVAQRYGISRQHVGSLWRGDRRAPK